ncbi:MAG: peptidylprolyl isomerase [Oscillospiraceae bacterium]|nr:peptidylprolyl isomerase [Oscillospiraceae bacterium]
MSDELNKNTESTEAPAEDTTEQEAYEGILGDYSEEAADAEAAAEGAAAPKEKKPAGKKLLTIAGICAAVVAVGGLGTFGVLKYREVMPKTAASSGNAKVTDRMAACYVQDVVNMYKSYYGEEALMSYYGLDLTKPLSEQEYPGTEGTTWLQSILTGVKNNVTQYLVLKQAGQAAGYQLTEDDVKEIEEKLAEADISTYGNKVTLADLRQAFELQAYSAGFYNETYDSFTFTDDEIQSYLDTNGSSYITCGLMGFSISYDLEDDTAATEEASTEEETTTEEEAPKMDQKTAEKLAKALEKATKPDQFESQVSDILTEYEGYSDEDLESLLPTITNENFGYMTGNELADWAFGGEAKVGDTLLIEGDGVYYVYLMTREPERDDSPTISVRHILFSIDDHLSVDADAATDEERAAALEECHQLADACLEEWKNGDATEDSFAALATERTEDPGSQNSGGLYVDVTQGQMVQPFNDWCFDESRQVGDTGIVETTYGVHVMFFSGKGDPAWKVEAVNGLRGERFQTWYAEQEQLYPVTINDEIFDTIEG